MQRIYRRGHGVVALFAVMIFCGGVAWSHPRDVEGEDSGRSVEGARAGWASGAAVRGVVAPPVGLSPISVQLHTHGSFSEGGGSMLSHSVAAAEAGVDAIWWTDHDNHLGIQEKTSLLSLDVLEEPVWANETTWQPYGNSEAALLNQLVEYTSPSAFDVATGSISNTNVFQGTGSFRVEASWPATNMKAYYWYLNSQGERTLRTTAAETAYRIGMFPEQVSADARPVIQFRVSAKPTANNTHTHYQIEYYLDNTTTQRQLVGLTLRIPVAYTVGQWNVMEFRPTDDLALGFPQFDARDNHLRFMYLGVESRNWATCVVYYDSFEILHVHSMEALSAIQRDMFTRLETDVPSVRQLQGVELSLTPRHMCEYGDIVLHDHQVVKALAPQTLPDGTITDSQAMHDWVGDYMVDTAHVRGNLVSWAHPFGTRVDPRITTPTKEAVLAKMQQVRLHECDLIEVGYRKREALLPDFLWLLDELYKSGMMPTGVGVRDTHGPWGTITTSFWIGHIENTFDSWAWSASDSPADMLAALASGRVYFGEIMLFDGGMDLTTDDGYRMGHIVLTDKATDRVHLYLEGARVGDELRIVEYGTVVETIPITSASVPHTWDVSIEPTLGTFTRVEVWDPDGVPFVEGQSARTEVVYSNPLTYVRSLPVEGIPGERAAFDLARMTCHRMGRFRLHNVEVIRQGTTDILRITGAGWNGGGFMDVDLSAVGGVLGVSLTGITGTWSEVGGVVSLVGLDQSGTIEITVPGGCAADANSDGVVDVNDISYVLFRLGGAPPEGDANSDGVIDVNDISYVLFRLGNNCI